MSWIYQKWWEIQEIVRYIFQVYNHVDYSKIPEGMWLYYIIYDSGLWVLVVHSWWLSLDRSRVLLLHRVHFPWCWIRFLATWGFLIFKKKAGSSFYAGESCWGHSYCEEGIYYWLKVFCFESCFLVWLYSFGSLYFSFMLDDYFFSLLPHSEFFSVRILKPLSFQDSIENLLSSEFSDFLRNTFEINIEHLPFYFWNILWSHSRKVWRNNYQHFYIVNDCSLKITKSYWEGGMLGIFDFLYLLDYKSRRTGPIRN